jgi:aspartate-semialdehyde dehydrogenase
VILIFNIVPLISEFTERKSKMEKEEAKIRRNENIANEILYPPLSKHDVKVT